MSPPIDLSSVRLNPFRWNSLKTRVTVFTLTIFLLSLWSLAFYASRMLRDDMQRMLSEQQFTTISFVAGEVNQQMADRWAALAIVAQKLDPATEAVRLVEQNEYDLILMDIQMPEMDGLDATRAIRMLPGRQNTPILAMSANVFDDDRQACSAAGMDDFITKPIKPEQLFETLLKWLSNKI